jgi:hypothetical protein
MYLGRRNKQALLFLYQPLVHSSIKLGQTNRHWQVRPYSAGTVYHYLAKNASICPHEYPKNFRIFLYIFTKYEYYSFLEIFFLAQLTFLAILREKTHKNTTCLDQQSRWHFL